MKKPRRLLVGWVNVAPGVKSMLFRFRLGPRGAAAIPRARLVDARGCRGVSQNFSFTITRPLEKLPFPEHDSLLSSY